MDKVKFYTFLCLIFLFGSACGDIPLDENWETGSHVQNATLVGTPSTTTKKPNEGLIEKYLGEHKYWKASLLLDEAGFETIVPVEFNVDDNKATIHLPEDVVEVTLKYEDSQLSTETDSEYGIEVSYIGDDESYPLDIYLFKEELSGRLMESESLLTIDDDILYDGKYFVADTLQCENKTIGDYCSDNGNSLFEIVNSKNIEEVT